MFKEIELGEILIYAFTAVLGGAVFAICAKLNIDGVNLPQFYAEKMRASLFTGFLTLGSFLLALKTGIVIKIKEGVYDKPDYQSKVKSTKLLKGTLTVYGPLRRLSRLLSVAVLAALVTSALQLTLGLVSNWIASAICLSFAAFSLSVLVASFVLIQINLGTWFDLMEEGTK